MGRRRRNPFGLQLLGFSFAAIVLLLQIQQCVSLTPEGLALLRFSQRVNHDPSGAFTNWDPNDTNPCKWLGVHCVDGKVQVLDLEGLWLEGGLGPELGELSHLRSLISGGTEVNVLLRFILSVVEESASNHDNHNTVANGTKLGMLYRNHFSGLIPEEIGRLKMLELLDLRNNDLNGVIPAEIRMIPSLKYLLVSGNQVVPSKPLEPDFPLELQLDGDCINTNLGHWSFVESRRAPTKLILIGSSLCNMTAYHAFDFSSVGFRSACFFAIQSSIWESSLQQSKKPGSSIIPMVGTILRSNFGKHYLQGGKENCCHNLPSSAEQFLVTDVDYMVNIGHRRRLLESLNNLPAVAMSSTELFQPIIPYTQSSGGYPAVEKHAPMPSDPALPSPPDHSPDYFPTSPNANNKSSQEPPVHQPSVHDSMDVDYFYAIAGVALLFAFGAVILYNYREKGAKAIAPWRTGMSGKLQKALVEGISKLNRAEIEAACEEFSNILVTFPGCKLYKGMLSDGAEIGVASTTIESNKEWPRHADVAFKKKIEKLSRIKHKNFVNILGYCQEDEPFTRMMVFEFAPNGSLYEHLHGEEFEHLDWTNRMRIIMGVAYCLEYMHHELNPPVVHSRLQSTAVLLTYDCAAKVAEINFWMDLLTKSNTSDEERSEHSQSHPEVDVYSNVYNFGIMLLEIVSGKLIYTEEQGSIVNWATPFLNNQEKNIYMIDPSLECFKKNELDVICEITQECINEEQSQRPTIKDVASKLRSVTGISPNIATPSFSPLWRQELQLEDTT